MEMTFELAAVTVIDSLVTAVIASEQSKTFRVQGASYDIHLWIERIGLDLLKGDERLYEGVVARMIDDGLLFVDAVKASQHLMTSARN